jgi:hypothetical protein
MTLHCEEGFAAEFTKQCLRGPIQIPMAAVFAGIETPASDCLVGRIDAFVKQDQIPST